MNELVWVRHAKSQKVGNIVEARRIVDRDWVLGGSLLSH